MHSNSSSRLPRRPGGGAESGLGGPSPDRRLVIGYPYPNPTSFSPKLQFGRPSTGPMRRPANQFRSAGFPIRRLIYAAIGITVILFLYSRFGPEEAGVRPPLKLPGAYDMRYWLRGQKKPLEDIDWPRATGEKYLAWKSWRAGFNNERISLELAFSFALLWNRTLVRLEIFLKNKLKVKLPRSSGCLCFNSPALGRH